MHVNATYVGNGGNGKSSNNSNYSQNKGYLPFDGSSNVSIYDKKMSWYVSLIIKKLNKKGNSPNSDYSLGEIKKLINVCSEASVLLEVFINRYYRYLLPDLIFIVKDAIKTFFAYSKVSVFKEKEIKLLKYAIKNMEEHDIYSLEDNLREKSIKKIFYSITNNLKDIEYISSQYKYKSYQFAYQVQDTYMLSQNNSAGQLDIKINDYVIVDPTKLFKGDKPAIALMIMPELDIYSLLSHRKKYCHKQCKNCNTNLNMLVRLDNKAEICYKSIYYNSKDCLSYLLEQLIDKKLFKRDMNHQIDTEEKILTIELDKNIVKQISVPMIRIINYLQSDNIFEVNAFHFGYYKTFINADYFYKNYYVGMVNKTIKNEESIKYQKFELDENEEEDIQMLDLVQIGLESVLERYTKKINIDTISPLQFLKGFVMWYVYPFKKELKDISSKKYYIKCIKDQNNDDNDNDYLDLDYYFNKNNAFMFQNSYIDLKSD